MERHTKKDEEEEHKRLNGLMKMEDINYLSNLGLKRNSLYILLLDPDWKLEGEDYVCPPHERVSVLF